MTRDRPGRVASCIVVAIAITALGAVAAGVVRWRWGRGVSTPDDWRTRVPPDRASMLPKGAPSRFLQPRAVGLPIEPRSRPLVAHVSVVDLDQDVSAPTTRGTIRRRRASSGWRTTAVRFAMHAAAASPTHLVTVAAGDLTGDGRPDLVTGGLHISRPYDRMSRITVWANDR